MSFLLCLFQPVDFPTATSACGDFWYFKFSFSPSGLSGLGRNNFLFMWLDLPSSWLSGVVLGSTMINLTFVICVLQKPGGPVLPGKPCGLFLNLFLTRPYIECGSGVLGHLMGIQAP